MSLKARHLAIAAALCGALACSSAAPALGQTETLPAPQGSPVADGGGTAADAASPGSREDGRKAQPGGATEALPGDGMPAGSPADGSGGPSPAAPARPSGAGDDTGGGAGTAGQPSPDRQAPSREDGDAGGTEAGDRDGEDAEPGKGAQGLRMTQGPDGKWYCYRDGVKVTGQVAIGGSWYYFDPAAGGARAAGFVTVPDGAAGKTVYLDP